MVSAQTLREIVKQVVDHFEPEKVILFGSYAQGSPRQDSDVDLLIVAESDVPSFEMGLAVRRLLTDYPIPFDIIVQTPDMYQRRRGVVNTIGYFADKYGKVMYERSQRGRKWFEERRSSPGFYSLS